MKKSLLAGAAALTFVLTTPGDAQVVYCSNCSTVSQQLLDYARQFQQLTNEIQTAQNTLNTYINLVQNTVNLPSTVYRDLTADINRITSIANQANMLAGQTKLMLTNLSSTSGYPLGNISNWHQELSNESAAISNALTTAANTLNLQQTQMNNDSASLALLQTQALGTSGRQMTLQTLAGALSTIGQLVQTRIRRIEQRFSALDL